MARKRLSRPTVLLGLGGLIGWLVFDHALTWHVRVGDSDNANAILAAHGATCCERLGAAHRLLLVGRPASSVSWPPEFVLHFVLVVIVAGVIGVAWLAFLEDLLAGVYQPAPPTLVDLARCLELQRAYLDLNLGVVDASIVALGERLGEDKVATLDHRHFRAVRPAHTDFLHLVP